MQWRDDTTPQLALGGSPLEPDAKVRGWCAYFGCSLCAASGHAAVPPSSVMNCAASFNDLVGEREQPGRNFEPKHFRGINVHNEVKLGRLHYR